MELDFEKRIVEIEKRIEELTRLNENPKVNLDGEIRRLEKKLARLKKKVYTNLTPWQMVQVARHDKRPVLQDYLRGIFSEFIELHGDRRFGDDRALIGGFALIGGHRVMLIGMEKGKTVEQRVACNFGMSNPEGYRKAMRLMQLAEKYGLPVVSMVDTPAAYPGREAEERGQAEAIARNLCVMAALETPILVVVTGEGGSGGALGIAVGDTVMMLSNAIYSVIPPEGCAAILWREASKAPEAAEALKITAENLLQLGVIDEIVPEPAGGAHGDYAATFEELKTAIVRNLELLQGIPIPTLVEKRYEKYSRIGRIVA
jgi:acetyl-CoA carboxylase carboxyl transferase subunit alpha